jgi:outer membrane lipoprotein-sorting protein
MVRRYARGLVRPVLLLSGFALSWSSGAFAQQAAQTALPAARDIITKYVEATGGASAFKSISSMRAKGTFTITGQQMSGELEMMAARPNKLLTRIAITGIGPVEEGYDGKIGWSIDPFRGPALITGRGLDERADEAWFDAPLHGGDQVKEMTVLGKEEFDGRQVYRVKVVSLRGTEQFELFDEKTGLQAGVEATRETPLGIIPTTTMFRDFQRFGQLTFPATVVQRIMGQEQVFTFTIYEFNTLPPSTFELPPAIKALIK